MLVVAVVWALTLAFGKVSTSALIGLAFWVGVAIWAGQRTYHLFGVALVLEGVERTRDVLADRGVLVSREKALQISAGIMEAQRCVREAAAENP